MILVESVPEKVEFRDRERLFLHGLFLKNGILEEAKNPYALYYENSNVGLDSSVANGEEQSCNGAEQRDLSVVSTEDLVLGTQRAKVD